MKKLWSVEFSLAMQNFVESDMPSIYGQLLVRGNDITDAIERAKYKLNKLGYDEAIIHGANLQSDLYSRNK